MRVSLLLTAVALAAFGFSVAGSFHFDDYALFNDPSITSWTATRPLTNVTFRANEILGGRDPFGYHLLNLLLHVAAVLLLRMTLASILPARPALIAALIFAAHPIQAEAVNYVFARGTLLATVFCILSLFSWLRGRHWLAALPFSAALLAKEEAVSFPLVLLLLHFSISRNRKELPPIAAMLGLSLAAGLRVLLATAEVQGSATGFSAHVSPIDYLSVQGVAILRYIQLVLLPWGYTVDPDLWIPAPWLRVAAWLAILALAAIAARRFSGAHAGFWFIGALILLLPSSSIFPADDYAVDRRMYLPMAALSAGIGLLLARVDRRIIAAAVIALVAVSVRYTWIWQTEERLWTEAARLAPGRSRPRLWLSRSAATPEESLSILAAAQSIAPADPAIASEQGRVLLTMGRAAEALAAFGRALALAPNDPVALSNRGAALAALGQSDAARQDFERALKRDPCQFNARLNLKRTTGQLPPASGCLYTAEQQQELEP